MRRLLIVTAMLLCLIQSMAEARTSDDATDPKEAPSKKSEISDILDSMGYPELQVVPRASERLAIEAKSEDTAALITHWPIQFSGLATLFVGMTAKGNQRTDLTPKEKTDSAMISSITTAVGLGWIVGTAVISAQRPYRSGMNAINKYPGKDDRATLLRERLAEEALERPAKTWRIFQNVAVMTNFTVCAASAWHANETGKIMAGVAGILAFVPYIFEDHAIEVYDKHIEYKKKIYTPLKGASLHYESKNRSFTPLATLTWNF